MAKKNDIKIFVSHRIDLDAQEINNPLFYPVRCGATYDKKDSSIQGDNTGKNISEKRMSFNELTVQYWAWQNVEADYYGLCHYRRYFSFSKKRHKKCSAERNNGCYSIDYINEENVIEHGLTEDVMRKNIENCDAIFVEPINLKKLNIRCNYDAMKMCTDYHNIKDMDVAIKIIKEKYPHMSNVVDKYMKESDFSYLYNCFIMKADLFKEYSKWLFDILFELEKRIDMSKYSTKKYRTPGTIGERLLGIFALFLKEQNKYKIKEMPLLFIEHAEKEPLLTPAFDKNQITIVSNFDNNYAPIFGTFLISAIEHFSQNHNYDIIVLTQDISCENKKVLDQIAKNYSNISLRYYNPARFLSGIKKCVRDTCYTEDLYFRVVIPYVLQNFDKVLVVDADMLCKKDLRLLFEEDISSYLAAAVKDTVMQGYLNGAVVNYISYSQKTLKMEDPYLYVNTGVILMNCSEIRKKYSLEYLQNFIKKYMNIFRIYEQDMLNYLLYNNIKFLDQKWNFFVTTSDFIAKCINFAPINENKKYTEDKNNPFIIHYAAQPKPWNNPNIDFGIEWWNYTRKSPFYEIMLYNMNKNMLEKNSKKSSQKTDLNTFCNKLKLLHRANKPL